MSRKIRYGLFVVVGIVLACFAGLYGWEQYQEAVPAPGALASLASDSEVTVTNGRWLEFHPASGEPSLGVIFYPGAYCDIRGYGPVLRRIAAQGYLVVDVQMPFGLSVLGANKALEVESAHPEIKRWALIGHSLGGAIAAYFVYGHPHAVSGLILWDSYPPEGESLAKSPLPITLIRRGHADGTTPEIYKETANRFPPQTHVVVIEGGQHMYFGSFVGGGYKEDAAPGISRESQQNQAVDATLEALRKLD